MRDAGAPGQVAVAHGMRDRWTAPPSSSFSGVVSVLLFAIKGLLDQVPDVIDRSVGGRRPMPGARVLARKTRGGARGQEASALLFGVITPGRGAEVGEPVRAK
ncbi:hypothetical protein FKO01_26025 [Mesorhizobium sp. B2-3-3]|nr:hypothetical protein FKO01_26025 [Mesorhizobium sp. B2-3-3]